MWTPSDMNRELLNDIKAIFSDPVRSRSLKPRGDEERAFLSEWLAGKTEKIESRQDENIAIENIISECAACSDAVDKKTGFGTGKNGVMILLNQPNMISNAEKKHLKAESVDLLKKMVAAMGIEFSECYLTNLIKCEPDGTIVKPSEMLSNCRNIFEKEIAFYSPKIVIVMGDILPLQKIVHNSVRISWFRTEHPITLIKNPDLKRAAWNTLKNVIEKLKG